MAHVEEQTRLVLRGVSVRRRNQERPGRNGRLAKRAQQVLGTAVIVHCEYPWCRCRGHLRIGQVGRKIDALLEREQDDVDFAATAVALHFLQGLQYQEVGLDGLEKSLTLLFILRRCVEEEIAVKSVTVGSVIARKQESTSFVEPSGYDGPFRNGLGRPCHIDQKRAGASSGQFILHDYRGGGSRAAPGGFRSLPN